MQIMKTIVLQNMSSTGNLARFSARPKTILLGLPALALLGPIQSTLLRFCYYYYYLKNNFNFDFCFGECVLI